VYLELLHLINFKNYAEAKVEFPARVNFLIGPNGSGKTNLLDAIHLLSATRSFLHAGDVQHIRYGQAAAQVRGIFAQETGERRDISCTIPQQGKKDFRVDNQPCRRLSDHVGRFPLVVISPHDADLLHDGSEGRRKFFDQFISQTDPVYLQQLVEYHRVLKQRNRILEHYALHQQLDTDLLESYDHQLSRTGTAIRDARKQFIQQFRPTVEQQYRELVPPANRNEKVNMQMVPSVFDDYLTQLTAARPKDLAAGLTTYGIHRDDYRFEFGHGELRKLGSQGQQKTFLVALKLAQVQWIKDRKGFAPVLLLDDIFDKLDDFRMNHLIDLVTAGSFGQLFVTDAGFDRSAALVQRLPANAQVFSVEAGHIRQHGR
jgi:DNA replication and repair protein RecF